MRLIAHRGGSLEAPENTLRAFRHAVAAGCDMLEMDLRETADGAVVVLHDPEVDRVTDGCGPIAALGLAEARTLDAAHWFVPGRGADPAAGAFPLRGGEADLRIPTLEEVLRALPGVPLTLDLKVGPPERPDFPAAVAALLRAHGRRDDVIVGSFAQVRLDAFRALAPEVPTSATQEEVQRVWMGEALPAGPRLVAFQVPAAVGSLEVVTPDLVARAHGRGAEVHVWTVDEPAELARLRDLGVDGVITDRPRVLAAVLGRGGGRVGSPPQADGRGGPR